jgi:DNA-binding response OmpR family regulator
LLRDAGHTVATAPDGQRALEALRAGPCDLIVAALDLPVLDGASLALITGAEAPGVGIALLTGTRRSRNLEALADIVLGGTVPDADLRAAVEAVLAARAQRRQSAGQEKGRASRL